MSYFVLVINELNLLNFYAWSSQVWNIYYEVQLVNIIWNHPYLLYSCFIFALDHFPPLILLSLPFNSFYLVPLTLLIQLYFFSYLINLILLIFLWDLLISVEAVLTFVDSSSPVIIIIKLVYKEVICPVSIYHSNFVNQQVARARASMNTIPNIQKHSGL